MYEINFLPKDLTRIVYSNLEISFGFSKHVRSSLVIGRSSLSKFETEDFIWLLISP